MRNQQKQKESGAQSYSKERTRTHSSLLIQASALNQFLVNLNNRNKIKTGLLLTPKSTYIDKQNCKSNRKIKPVLTEVREKREGEVKRQTLYPPFVFCPVSFSSPPTSRSRQPPLLNPGSARTGLLPVKYLVFPFHCRQVLIHSGSSDCWGCLSIIVGSLPYSIKCLEGDCCCSFALYNSN